MVKEADGLRAEADQSVAEAEEAHKRAARAEAEATSRVQGNDALLKKLLAEQRAMFEKETAEMRAALSAKTAAEEREARIELMKKQASRRIMYGGIAKCFLSWVEMREAKREAERKVNELSSRLGVRGVGGAFKRWERACNAQKYYLESMSKNDNGAHRTC